MRKPLVHLLVLSLGVLWLSGCGSAGGGSSTDYQAGGERLQVVSVTPASGDAFVANVLAETNDYGADNTAATEDEGEGDSLPTSGETVVAGTEPTDVLAKLSVENVARLQDGQATDLTVTRVDVRYLDKNQHLRFAVNYQHPSGTVTIKPGATADLTINLLPLGIIVQTNGPQEIFWTKNNLLIDPIRTLTAVLDIYAEDAMNSNNEVHIQHKITIALQNPMEH